MRVEDPSRQARSLERQYSRKVQLISIIVPTCRIGGLDILFSGLEAQSEKDFELVLADGVHGHRGALREPSFRFRHVPVEVSFERNEYCRTVNAGIEAASGDILMFLTDYTWLPEAYVALHAGWHSEHPDRADCLTTAHRYSECPPVSPEFPRFRQQDMAEYASQLRAGRLDRFGYSIFERQFGPEDVKADPRHVTDIDADGTELMAGGPDPKDSMAEGGIDPNFIHLKGDSVKREMAEALRNAPGSLFPEELDGGHGYQDTWFATAAGRKGARWTLSRALPNWVPQVRDRFPRMPRTRKFSDQHAMMRTIVERT